MTNTNTIETNAPVANRSPRTSMDSRLLGWTGLALAVAAVVAFATGPSDAVEASAETPPSMVVPG